MNRKPTNVVAAVFMTLLLLVAFAQDLPPGEGFDIQVLTEKEVTALPEGELFWRIENFPTLEAAEAAAGTWGLTAETAGEVWLFTLSPEGESSQGGTLVAEVGPLPEVVAEQYLLRVNEATAIPGGTTITHNHPGSEAIYVLEGELTMHTPGELLQVPAHQPQAGHAPATVMQVSNGGSADMRALVMFVVDATQPFSSPAEFP